LRYVTAVVATKISQDQKAEKVYLSTCPQEGAEKRLKEQATKSKSFGGGGG